MKKIVLVALIVMMLFVSCSSTSPFMGGSKKKNVSASSKELIDKMPSWVISDPSDDETIYVYGYGKADTREAAMAYARNEALAKLAEQVSLVIDRSSSNMLTNEKSAGESTSINKLVEQTKTQAHSVVNGARQTNLYLVSDTELYVQYGVKAANLTDQVLALMNTLNEQLKNSDSTYNVEAFDYLNYQDIFEAALKEQHSGK